MGKAKKELRRVREALGEVRYGDSPSTAVHLLKAEVARCRREVVSMANDRDEARRMYARDHAELARAMVTIHRAEKAIDSVAGLPQKRPLDAAVEELVEQRNHYHDAEALVELRAALREALDLGDEADRDPSVNDLATVARARLRKLL